MWRSAPKQKKSFSQKQKIFGQEDKSCAYIIKTMNLGPLSIFFLLHTKKVTIFQDASKKRMLSLLLSLMPNLTGQLSHPVSRRHYTTQKDNKPYRLGHRISNMMRMVMSLANLWPHILYKTPGYSVFRDPQARALQPRSFQTRLCSSVCMRMLIIHCTRT